MLTSSEAMFQAVATIDLYFHGAVDMVDKEFGEEYAEAHPELVAALVTAMTQDFDSWVRSKGDQ